MIIAIDGMSATGKSTAAFNLAKKLKLKYLNSGSIYRCVALKIMRGEIDVNNEDELKSKIENLNIDFKIEDDIQKVYLDEIDVTTKIKEEAVSVFTPKNASNPVLKAAIRTVQKRFIENGDIVIEGRDIATRIAPNAEYKFYLTASLDVRAKRVYDSLKDKENITLQQAKENLYNRDKLDVDGGSTIIPKDAYVIDTDSKNAKEVVEAMLEYIK